MVLRKRIVVVSLLASLALNAALLAMVISSTTVMNELSEQVEETATALGVLTTDHKSSLSEAAQLRDELRTCRVDLIKRLLGIREPAAPAPQPPARAHAS